MSVDAVNGVNAQQQPQKSSALPSAIAGHYFGGKKPTLEELFTQKPDTFDKAEDKEAVKKLQDAITEYKNAGATEKATLRKANNGLNTQINATTVDKQTELQKAIDDAKDALSKKEVKIGDKSYKSADIAKELNDAHAAVEAAKNGDDAAKAAATKQLNDARAHAKEFNEGVKSEAKAVTTAKKALVDAKKAKFEEAAKADGAEKTLKTAAEDAKKAFGEAKSKKLTEIIGRDEIKQAYEKIKGALPKEGKGKMAAIAGGIAAAVGLIGGYLMGGSHNDNA